MSTATSLLGRTQSASSHPTRSVRVLVVDDYPDNAESMAMFLELHGHDVRTARNGWSALRTAQAEPPDVVLLDLSMPGMNGYETARQMRTLLHDRVMLIAITGRQLDEEEQGTVATEFDRYFLKPADPDAVENLLEELPGSPLAGCSSANEGS